MVSSSHSFNIQDSVDVIKSSLHLSPASAAVDRVVKWNCPNHSCYILNVDGSCLGSPQRADFGGLLRNNAGLFISDFSGHIVHSDDILLAELHAIHTGLQMVSNLNIADFVCQSDSLHCVSLINGPTMEYHVYATLIQDIKDLVQLRNTPILHTLREGNRCADFLAKLEASMDSALSNQATPPDDLLPLLRDDSWGTFFPRG